MTERAGQMLGNYRLVQLLGQGSVTEVYLGEHIRQKTLAALKVWHNRLDGEDSLRFQAEAGRIALLEHEHIVPLLEYGVTENLAFVAMEYASGKSLRLRYHRGRQLSLATIVPIARQLAEALEYAHNAGIVHGDITLNTALIWQILWRTWLPSSFRGRLRKPVTSMGWRW
jgi:eukaryotic-like serine/threonine-protein kinase